MGYQFLNRQGTRTMQGSARQSEDGIKYRIRNIIFATIPVIVENFGHVLRKLITNPYTYHKLRNLLMQIDKNSSVARNPFLYGNTLMDRI